MNWKGDDPNPPQLTGITPLGWFRAALKALVLAIVVLGGLGVHLLVRLIEARVHGARRPWTAPIVVWVSRASLVIIGLPLRREGVPMTSGGALVANHSSWLDIFALSCCDRFYFVAKSEVAGWAVIGWLARATGTVFIRRDRRDAANQQRQLGERIALGHRLLFFPEGTSTDGQRVLPFKSPLFEPFLAATTETALSVQPVTVVYDPPAGADPKFYGWWGEMDFAPHLIKILAARRQGRVTVVFHPEIALEPGLSRKDIAARAEALIRSAHPFGEGSGGQRAPV